MPLKTHFNDHNELDGLFSLDLRTYLWIFVHLVLNVHTRLNTQTPGERHMGAKELT